MTSLARRISRLSKGRRQHYYELVEKYATHLGRILTPRQRAYLMTCVEDNAHPELRELRRAGEGPGAA